MKKKLLIFLIGLMFGSLMTGVVLAKSNLAKRLAGRILLQVESRGEAWYIDPVSLTSYYLKDGPAAYDVMRKLGLGIKNKDLNQIPISDKSSNVNANNVSVDCGVLDYSNSLMNGIIPENDCFNENFKICKTGTTISIVGVSREVVIGLEIIGIVNNQCEVKWKGVSYPNPNLINKEMICMYNNTKKFEDAILRDSSYNNCSGQLYELLTSNGQLHNNPDCTLKTNFTRIEIYNGVGESLTASRFKGNASQVSWVIDDASIATVSPSSGETAMINAVNTGSTQLTVTDNAVGLDCFVSVPITIN